MLFWDFYEIENLSKKQDGFLLFIRNFMKNHSLEKTLEVLRISGICFNPYNINDVNNDFFSQVITEIEIHFSESNDKTTIKHFKNNIDTLKNVFQEFNSERKLRNLDKLKANRRLASFIISVEMLLGSIIEEEKVGKEQVYPDFGYFDYYKRHYNTKKYKQVLSNVGDSIVEYASNIYKFLLYENGDLDKLETLKMSDIKLAGNHIELFDKFSALLNVEQIWRFTGASITEQNNQFKINLDNEQFLKGVETAKIRFDSQKIKWFMGFNKLVIERPINPDSIKLAPQEYLSKEEVYSSIALSEYLNIRIMNIKCLDITIAEWIRAYTLIIMEAKKELNERLSKRVVPPTNLNNWIIYKQKSEWIRLFSSKGISEENSESIINKLTFSKDSRDLLDCPFIEHSDSLGVIPSISSVIDPSLSIISLLTKNGSDVSFKGAGFENDVLADLKKVGLKASMIKIMDKGEEYQCDAAFTLENNLFLIEAKAFSQSTSLKDYYNLQLKLIGPNERLGKKNNEKSAVEQLSRIADFYKNHMDLVKTKMGISNDWVCEKVYKVVLTTAMLGEPIFINDTHIVDYSSFKRFLDRNPLRIMLGEKEYVFKMKDYKGEITSEKLLNFLRNPAPINLQHLRLSTENRVIRLNHKELLYPNFIDNLGHFILLNQREKEEIERILEEE
ncbi:hypothetical protein [Bacillus sp. FSL M8-0077]|uniref:hypothetical protein n=1 Tax=Bacillus sp. FSL M8-0077 TaxID=2954556 RepID=UPI0030FD6F1B